MTDLWLRATVRWTVRLLLVLLLAGGLHVAMVAWNNRPPTIVVSRVPQDSDTAQALPGGLFGLEALRSKLAPAIPSDLLSPDAPTAGASSRPKRIRIYLVVNVAPDRSEVLVNGIAEGHTPYVGEVTCHPGSKLTVTVVPKRGLPKHFERACDRSEMRIEE